MIIDKKLELPKSPYQHLSLIKWSGLSLRLVGFELKTADRDRAKNGPWPGTSVIPQDRPASSTVSLHRIGARLARNSWQYTRMPYFLIRMGDPGIYLYLNAL